MRILTNPVFSLIVGGLIGVVLAVTLQPTIENGWNKFLDWRFPSRALDQADKLRKSMDEAQMEEAVHRYRMFTTGHTSASVKARAYQAMSRAEADLCDFRYRQGLNYEDYAKASINDANEAEKNVQSQLPTAIVLPYAYYCSEAESENRPATTAKVKELQTTHSDNLDVQFLAWRLGLPDSKSYPDRLEEEQEPDLIPLLAVAASLTDNATDASDPVQRKQYLARANVLLGRAEHLYPRNAFVLVGRAYSARSQSDIVAAQVFYNRALDLTPVFPRVRTNLGRILAILHKWDEARFQFQEAANSDQAPVLSRLKAIGNIGDTYWEEQKQPEACNAWSEASQFRESPKDGLSVIHVAMCAYSTNRTESRNDFAKAVEIGKDEGKDPTKFSTFETSDWQVPAAEFDIIKRLIADYQAQKRF